MIGEEGGGWKQVTEELAFERSALHMHREVLMTAGNLFVIEDIMASAVDSSGLLELDEIGVDIEAEIDEVLDELGSPIDEVQSVDRGMVREEIRRRFERSRQRAGQGKGS